mmetsp:Transcript_88395/g.153113  ORF Transcript_88395/g.153113 Transcript_88395/m.153113 type:complete len:415 (-) Transcript_88395:78-1322(-)
MDEEETPDWREKDPFDHVRHGHWELGQTPGMWALKHPPEEEEMTHREHGKPGQGKIKDMLQKVRNLTRGKGRDPLLAQGNQAKMEKGKKQEEEKARVWASLNGFAMAIVSMMFYAVMIVMWFAVYHDSFFIPVGVLFLLLALSGAIAYVGASSKEKGKPGKRRWLLYMGIACAICTLVGTVTGFFLYFKSLAYYYRYKDMRTYTNVGASQNAASFNDGAMFLFTEDSRLDVMRAAGFKSKWTGETYCVAPVVDSVMNNGNYIYFWSIGMNCCLARAGFSCDDAADPSARSALVVLEPEDVVRPFMQWAVAGSFYPSYVNGINLEVATYGTTAAPKPKLLYWTNDPVSYMNGFHDRPKNLCIMLSIIYFIIDLVLSYIVCLAWRYQLGEMTKQLALRNSELNKPGGKEAAEKQKE